MSLTTTADGLVLHLTSFGEAHRIVEVLTRDHGRLTVVARGARSSKRRFGAALDLFMTARLSMTPPKPGQTLWTLAGAELVQARLGIRTSLEAFERASLLCEASRYLFAEAQRVSEAYATLSWALDALDRGEVARAAQAWVSVVSIAGIVREPPQRCAAEVRACFAGAACTDPLVAQAVESICTGWVEQETGRRLLSRLS